MPSDPAIHPLVHRAALLVGDVGADPELLRDLIGPTGPTRPGLDGHLRGPGRLLPAVGQPGRPAGAGRLRCLHARTGGLVRRRLHRPAARRALPGRGRGRRRRADLPARPTTWPASGSTAAELAGPGPRRRRRLRGLLGFEAARARRLLERGPPLVPVPAGPGPPGRRRLRGRWPRRPRRPRRRRASTPWAGLPHPSDPTAPGHAGSLLAGVPRWPDRSGCAA